MGIFGWRLLAHSPQTLIGTVTKYEYNGGFTGDGDWSLYVKPDNPDDPLLTNSSGPGRTNHTGQIECEIEPSVDPTGDHDSYSAMGAQFFGKLVGKHVQVWGPWVADCSHAWNDDSCPGCCGVGKTEIHPIFSVEALMSESPDAKEVEVFVFSDDSDDILPPNSGENIPATFAIAFPSTPPDALYPKFYLASESNQARSVTYNLTTGDPYVLHIAVQSGTPDEGKGFYHAAINIGFVFSSLRRNLASRGDLAQGLRSLHPWFDAPIVSVRAVLQNIT